MKPLTNTTTLLSVLALALVATLVAVGCSDGSSSSDSATTDADSTPSAAPAGVSLSPKEALSFRTTQKLSPGPCPVSDVRMIDGGSLLLAFVVANCGAGRELYVMTLSDDGQAVGQASAVGPCRRPIIGGELLTMDVAASNNGALAVLICGSPFTSPEVITVAIDGKGRPGTPVSQGTVSNGPTKDVGTLQLVFNPQFTTFGVHLTKLRQFRRISPTGEPLGGSTPVSVGLRRVRMTYGSGQWLLLESWDTEKPECQAIGSSGADLDGGTPVIPSKTGRNATYVVGGRWALLVGARGNTTTEVAIADFDPATCGEANVKEVPGAPTLNDVQGTVLPGSRDLIVLRLVSGSGELRLTAFDPVARQVTLELTLLAKASAAHALSARGRLYLAAVRDSEGLLSVNTYVPISGDQAKGATP